MSGKAFDTTAFETLAGLVLVLEPTGAIVYWNRATTELLGRPVDEVRGQLLWTLPPAADAVALEAAIRHAAATRRSGRIETTLASRTGAPRIIAFATSVAADLSAEAEGAQSLVILTGVDITDAVADRDADLARLSALLEQAPDGIFVADLQGRYTDVNDAGCRLLGYSRQEIIGKSITDLIPPEDISRLWDAREQLLKGRMHVARWTLRRKDGSFAPVEVSAKILPDGRWQGLARGITERLQLEQSLRDGHAELSRAQAVAHVGSWRLLRDELVWSDEAHRIFGTAPGARMTYQAEEQRVWREQLEAIISIAVDAIISIDEEQRVVVYNECAETIFGWSRPEMLGQPLELLIPERFRNVHRHHITRFAGEACPSRRMGDRSSAIVGLRKSGEEFPAEAAISRVEVAGKVLITVTLRDISERVAAEQERERLLSAVDSERRWLRAVLDIVPLGIVLFEPDGRLYFNPQAEELLGMSPLPSGSSASWTHRLYFPDGCPVPRNQTVLARVMQTGETVIAEEHLVERPDGSRIHTLWSAAPLRDDEEHVVGAIGVFQNVSERIRAEQALRLSEERLRVALQASPAVVFNQDLELRYTWIHNPKQPFMAEQVLGKTDHDLLSHADAEELTSIKRRVLKTGAGARTIIRTTLDGETLYYDLTIEPIRSHTGRIVGITCAAWEVTDQQRAEESQRFLAGAGTVLLSATLNYEQMLTHLGQLAVRELADWFLVDVVEAGRIRRLRIAHSDPTQRALAERLERLPLDRTLPHLMFEPLHARQTQLASSVTDVALERLAQSDEHLRVLRALNVRSFIAVPLLSRGRLLGAFALISSRDERRYRDRDVPVVEEFARVAALAVENAQLYEATQRAVTARDEVLGIVAHDLRNPLNTVLMQAELLRGLGGEPERASQTSLDIIRRAAHRMSRLIQDMLDIARLEAGSLAIERAVVATRALLDEALEGQREPASRAGLGLRLESVEPLPDVLGDRDRLLQIFDNLIGNAIKFTPPDGAVVVCAEPRMGEVLFRVADTGPGIAPEHIPHLFDPFWQANKTDRRGAGLGLPIVKGLVESHGGRIWVESQPERGSTFYFTVPVAAPAPA